MGYLRASALIAVSRHGQTQARDFQRNQVQEPESFHPFLMASTSTIKNLTLHGKGLKLNTREDIEPYLKDIDPTLLEEIHLGGNTIGVEASQALAEFLAKTQILKVRKNQ